MEAVKFLIWIVALLVAAFLIFKALAKDEHGDFSIHGFGILGAVGLLVVAFLITSSFGQIDPGNRGVVITLGKVHAQDLSEGPYFVTPGIDKVVQIPVRVQTYSEDTNAASHDLQDVATTVTLNFNLDPQKVPDVYRRLGDDESIKNGIIAPAVKESVKAVTSKYTAEQLITQRAQARDLLDSTLQAKLTPYNIIVSSISITNFKFSDQFNQAIEKKVTAVQDTLTEEQNLKKEKYIAQQRVVDATADSTANRLRAASANPKVVQLKFLEKWDGKLPNTMVNSGGSGGGINALINTGTP